MDWPLYVFCTNIMHVREAGRSTVRQARYWLQFEASCIFIVLEIEISNNPHIDRIILSIDRSLIFCCNLYDKYISLIILIHVYI
jgi:hypothetical protein